MINSRIRLPFYIFFLNPVYIAIIIIIIIIIIITGKGNGSLGTSNQRFDFYFHCFSVNLGLEIKKSAFSVKLYHKDGTAFRPLNKVEPCSAGLVLGWVTI